MKNIKILAHRGYQEIAPENTKFAFEQAYKHNFDGVELDVHLTRDNHLVITHDEDVVRTSEGLGNIRDLSLDQLRRFNFGIKFKDKIKKQTIMTYEEFLSDYGNKFKVINVELKTDKFNYPGIEEEVLRITKQYSPKAKIIFSSFNFSTLENLRDIDKDVELGFLFYTMRQFNKHVDRAKDICQYIIPVLKLCLGKKSSKILEKLDMKVIVWDFSRPAVKQAFMKHIDEIKEIRNIHAIISDSKLEI